MKEKEVLVIGAGPGGLAAAMLLARAGLKVTVYESRERVGGRTSALVQEGFRFDRGPTFFLYGRILEEIYAACGKDLKSRVEMKRLDPNYHLVFEEGGQIRPTCDTERLAEEVARIAPEDARQVGRYMEDNRQKLAVMRPILSSPFNGLQDTLRLPLLKLLPLIRPWLSMDGDLRRFFKDPRTRLAFTFQSKYLGMSPFRCPSLFTILSFLEYEYGVWHPLGGCSAVSEDMAQVAAELGAEFRLEQPVERILVEKGRARGVVTGQGEHRAEAVVLNADFAGAMTRLLPNTQRRRWRDERLAGCRYSCSTFMLYLGIEGRCDELAHHTIHLSRDYRDNLVEIERRHILSPNPSFYVQNASITDDTLAPEGKSTLYVLVPVTHQHPNVDWQREGPAFRELVLDRLDRVGLAGLRERIVTEKVYTPDDWAEEFRIYRGATFNLAHNLGQMLHLRPRNRFEDLPGTYLVGGGTHPGSGLPVIFESARISSRLLLQDLGLDSGWIDEPGRGKGNISASA